MPMPIFCNYRPTANSNISMVKKESFLNALRLAVNGVAVVTTSHNQQHNTAPSGLTISSFTSISAEPPIMQIAINRQSQFYNSLATANQFCLNILGENHQIWGERFSGRAINGNYQFDDEWAMHPIPHLKNGMLTLFCTMLSQQIIGTHGVFFGEISDIVSNEKHKPLAYYNRQYQHLI